MKSVGLRDESRAAGAEGIRIERRERLGRPLRRSRERGDTGQEGGRDHDLSRAANGASSGQRLLRCGPRVGQATLIERECSKGVREIGKMSFVIESPHLAQGGLKSARALHVPVKQPASARNAAATA